MRRGRWRFVEVSFVVGLACGGSGSGSDDGDECTVGAEGCACTPGGGCDPGLFCEDDVCVPEGGTSDGTGDDGGTSGEDGGTSDDGSGGTGDDGGTATGSTTEGTGGDTTSTGGGVPPNLVFVTSTTHQAGSLGGLAGADAICNQRASEAGLEGTYVAWLSDATTDAVDRLGDARGWVRTDGKAFVEDTERLLDKAFYYPIVYDENANTVSLGQVVITATQADGTGADTSGLYCGNWTDPDDPDNAFPVGRIGGGSRYWTEYTGRGCADEGHLFCFGVDHQHDLVFEPQSGRLAFTARAGLAANVGRAAADAQCQQVAEAAGYSGTFLAAMAVPGEAAADRFDLGGEDWVRVDGVVLFPSGEPMGSVLQAPILYDADGSMLDYSLTWAGATGPKTAGTAGSTCNGWTETTGSAPMGTSWDMSWWNWSISGTDECTVTVGVFCFET